MVELEDLRTVVEIVDGGSMRAAAVARGVTPSLVSRRLARLESRLGVTLIVRTTRSLSVTDAGRRFDRYAREILRRVTDVVDDMQGRGAQPRGLLRIAASTVYGSERVAPIFAAFLQEHPLVDGELVLDDVRADVIGNGFDAVIRIGTLKDSELVARPLEPYRMGLFAAPSYLRANGTPTVARDLEEHASIELGAAAARPWRLKGPDAQCRVRPRRRAVASGGYALLRMAEAGLGIIAQPHWLVSEALSKGTLVPLLTDHQLPKRTVHVLYRKSASMPAHLRAFIDALLHGLAPARVEGSARSR